MSHKQDTAGQLGVATFDTNQSAIAVRGDAQQVATRFASAAGAKLWKKDAYGLVVPSTGNSYVILQLKHHSWTLLLPYTVNDDAHDAVTQETAKKLSRGTAAVYYANSDTAAATGYSYFEKGKLVEQFESGPGEFPDPDDPGETYFSEYGCRFDSKRRKVDDARLADSCAFVDATFKELELYVPLPTWRDNQPKKSLPLLQGWPRKQIERVDFVSLVEGDDDSQDDSEVEEELSDELWDAIRANDPDRMRKVIAAGADVNKPSSLGSPLHWAALWAPNEKYGRLKNDPDCKPTDTRSLRILIEAGADPTILANRNQEALTEAAWAGDVELVRAIAAAGHDLNVKGTIEATVATDDGRGAETIPYLGATALIVAAGENEIEVARELIAAGAALGAIDDRGQTALALAEERGHAEVAEMLRAAGATVEPTDADPGMLLLLAAEQGRLEDVKKLVADGRDVDTRDTRRTTRARTPLMLAATNNHADVVRLLVASGANVNAKDQENEQVQPGAGIMLAMGDVDHLLEAGMLPGRNAVMYAAEEGAADAIRALAEAGADVNEASKYKERPIKLAMGLRRGPAVLALVAAGADVNARGSDKATPLMKAVQWEQDDLAAALIDAGAKLDLKDESGVTPLMEAIRRNRVTTIKRLIEAGAKLTIKDRQGRTALELADRPSVKPATRKLVKELYEKYSKRKK